MASADRSVCQKLMDRYPTHGSSKFCLINGPSGKNAQDDLGKVPIRREDSTAVL